MARAPSKHGRDQALDFQGFFNDLQDWELSLKNKDKKIRPDKEILKKATGALRSSIRGLQKSGKSENGRHIQASSVSNQRTEAAAVQDNSKEHSGPVSLKPSVHIEEIKSKSIRARSEDDSKKTFKDVNGSVVEKCKGPTMSSCFLFVYKSSMVHERSGKQELKVSVRDLATRAASRVMSEAAKKITPPNSAYQFEVSWRGFSSDRSLRAHLLKVTSPGSLPQIFKNALSAPLPVDIINEDIDLAVNYLDNLTKVPRFDMIVVCLSSEDKADLLSLWKEVFCCEAAPIEHAERLDKLRAKYCLKQ